MISVGSEPENQLFFNLSPSRLFISASLLLISAAFFFLALVAVKKHFRRESFLSKLLVNKKLLLIISIISIVISLSAAFILTRSHHFGGDWKNVIKQLEPVLACMIIFSNQTLFFIFLWFSAYFIVHKEKESIESVKKELFPVFVIFIIIAIFKWLTVSSSSFGPTGRGDEMTYYDMVDSLNRGFFSVDQTHHYPPLYPLVLLPALSFGKHIFTIIKLINVIVTTGIIFPTYLISRSFLDSRRSLIPALIACLIPYHLVIPMRIVSENLYYFLFMWMVFIVLKRPDDKSFRLVWDILTGIGLGLLYLARYISLAVIPMFLVSWWFKPFDSSDQLFKPSWKKILRFLMIALIAAVVFSPWIIGGIMEDVPVKLTLGFGITSRTNESQLTLINLLTWIALYSLYITLAAAPTLPLLLKSIPALFSKKWKDEHSRFIFEVLFLISGFLAAASRHSWRAFYNELVPSRIMGRYVAYLVVPFIILAFIKLNLIDKNQTRANKKNQIWLYIGSLLVVTLAYFTIIEKSVIELGPNFLQPLGSFDAYYASLLGILFFIFVGILYFIYWYLPEKANGNLLPIAGLVCVLFYISGWSAYQKAIQPIQEYPFLSSKIEEFARDVIPEAELEESISLLAPASAGIDQTAELYNGLRVRDIDNARILRYTSEEMPDISTNYGFIIHEYACDETSDSSKSRTAVYLDQAYCIELITK